MASYEAERIGGRGSWEGDGGRIRALECFAAGVVQGGYDFVGTSNES